MSLDRRQFVQLTVVFTGVALTGVAGALAAACSSDDPKTPTPAGTDAAAAVDSSTPKADAAADAAADSGGGTFKCRESISQNHGHAVTVPVADLDSTAAKTYSIQGGSTHGHNIKLEPQDFADLKAGLSVKKTSDASGQTHDHDVTILCASL